MCLRRPEYRMDQILARVHSKSAEMSVEELRNLLDKRDFIAFTSSTCRLDEITFAGITKN